MRVVVDATGFLHDKLTVREEEAQATKQPLAASVSGELDSSQIGSRLGSPNNWAAQPSASAPLMIKTVPVPDFLKPFVVVKTVAFAYHRLDIFGRSRRHKGCPIGKESFCHS